MRVALIRMLAMTAADRIARTTSTALAVVAAVTSAASFFLWRVFERDVPMGIGNMRGTALTILVIAVPLLLGSMRATSGGSLRARLVWLACLAYLAYNAVMLCFAASFNSFFLLFTTLLALAFWSLVALLRSLDIPAVKHAAARVPARLVAGYLLFSAAAFAALWLSAILPATASNTVPAALEELGLSQNPVWVLDFAFTFPLMVLGCVWMIGGHGWGYVISGMMLIMLTIETGGVAIDQLFGRLHDPDASLAAVPIMIAFTVVGLLISVLFLRGLRDTPPREEART